MGQGSVSPLHLFLPPLFWSAALNHHPANPQKSLEAAKKRVKLCSYFSLSERILRVHQQQFTGFSYQEKLSFQNVSKHPHFNYMTSSVIYVGAFMNPQGFKLRSKNGTA